MINVAKNSVSPLFYEISNFSNVCAGLSKKEFWRVQKGMQLNGPINVSCTPD